MFSDDDEALSKGDKDDKDDKLVPPFPNLSERIPARNKSPALGIARSGLSPMTVVNCPIPLIAVPLLVSLLLLLLL